MAAASRMKTTTRDTARVPMTAAGSFSDRPSQSLNAPMPALAKKVMTADAANAAPMPIAMMRLRTSTQIQNTSSVILSAIVRKAARSDPMAPIAAPTSAMIERIVVIVRPAGAVIAAGSMMPSSPMRPGIAASTDWISACRSSGLPDSTSPAIENPSSTPANTLKSAR